MRRPIKLRTIRVATFYERREGRAPRVEAYTRDYSIDWKGCRVYDVEALNGNDAKRIAIAMRRKDEQEAP